MSPRRMALGSGVEVDIGVAPASPIAVKPGQSVKAGMTFTNGGVLPITVVMRLDIQHENVLTPLESTLITSAEVAVGAAGSVACTYVIPSNWGAGKIMARVKAQVPGGVMVDIENFIGTTTAVWYIPAPSVAWLTNVVITYTAL